MRRNDSTLHPSPLAPDPRTFTVISLGCRSNYFDSQAMKQQLASEGYSYLPFAPGIRADLYLVNTCTVTSRADYDSRSWVRKAKEWNPSAAVIATGCYAQIQSPRLLREGADLVLGNREKERIGEILRAAGSTSFVSRLTCDPTAVVPANAGTQVLDSRLRGNDQIVGRIRRKGIVLGSGTANDQDRTRPVLKLQDGCDQCCSFCIIPTTRGRSRSLAPEVAVEKYRDLVKHGAREVVLSGINLSSYGEDLAPRTTLAALLARLESEADSAWVRVSSIEPSGLTDDLLKVIWSSRKLCPHFHIPLQSGAPDVLRRMGRPYSYAEFEEKINALADARPGMCIGTDVMVGFPGETEAQFENTLRAAEELPFSYLHVFPYSVRPGTKAAKMDGKVDRKTRRRRSTALCRIGARKRLEFLSRQLGMTHDALVESSAGAGREEWRATTRNYARMTFFAAGDLRNSVVPLRAIAVEGARIRAVLEDAEPVH